MIANNFSSIFMRIPRVALKANGVGGGSTSSPSWLRPCLLSLILDLLSVQVITVEMLSLYS